MDYLRLLRFIVDTVLCEPVISKYLQTLLDSSNIPLPDIRIKTFVLSTESGCPFSAECFLQS